MVQQKPRMTFDGSPVNPAPVPTPVVWRATGRNVMVIPCATPKVVYVINGKVTKEGNDRKSSVDALVARHGWQRGVLADFPQVLETFPDAVPLTLPVGTRIHGNGRVKPIKYGSVRFAA
jgi:hypothetical protein